MAYHSQLTGADLHEPKGISTALAGQVYIANGSGTGVWDYPNLESAPGLQLTSSSTTSQAADNLVGKQIVFGNASGNSGDPVQLLSNGTLQFNVANYYNVKATLQVGKGTGTGFSYITVWTTINGLPQQKKSVTLPDAACNSPVEFDMSFHAIQGAQLLFWMTSTAAGDEEGGLIAQSEAVAGLGVTPSAHVEVFLTSITPA